MLKTEKTPGFQRKPGVGIVEMGGIEPDPHNRAGRPLMRGFCAT